MSDKLNLVDELARYAKGQGKISERALIEVVQNMDITHPEHSMQVREVLKKEVKNCPEIPLHIKVRL